ncbi:MAG: sensor hybrid histidine kinase [Gemmatimonadetes bacterium]|nr:sensor hybrid histidine kinase [Gemmatimonadota bacterium]
MTSCTAKPLRDEEMRAIADSFRDDMLRDFLEYATDLIHMLAPDGRVLYANRAWRETLGYTQEETATLSMFDVVPLDSLDSARANLSRALNSESPIEVEMTVLSKDGRRIIVRGRANGRFVDGVAVSTRGIYRDVTAELEAAELLRKAQRTDAAAMRAKSAFLDRVSHELRTPLAAVIGFADILLQNRGGRLASTDITFVERIAAQGRHLLTLIEDVLAYAEIEARTVGLESTMVNVADLVRDVATLSGPSILVEAPSESILLTDADTLRRIIRYLVDDATRRSNGGEVTVRVVVDAASGLAQALEVEDDPFGGSEVRVPFESSVTLELGLTVARSLCQILGYRFTTVTNEFGTTTRRVELNELPQHDDLAQEELATTLHAFLEASPLPIVAFAPDWTVRVWNTAASRTFGWSSADVLGKRLPVLRTQDESPFRDMLRRALQTPGGIADEPTVHVRSDGAAVAVHASIAPLRSRDGRLRGFISIIADVSERKRLERELRQAQKMEVVGLLAGGIAHDFNNLLTVISAHTDFLLSDISVHDERRDDAVAIRDVANRASDLTRQLLLFTRNEAPERRVVDLSAKILDVARMLRRTIGSRIQIATVPAAEPVLAHADPSRVEQVLMNLALNARDAMPGGGVLTLETSVVPGEEGQQGTAVLTVRDTGVGMHATTRDHVFEPYFTTKERGQGTGLGLATVRTIVNEAGGSISLETELGKGTTFRIHLPLVNAPAAA